MHRNASPCRPLALVLLLASALSFYLALHMGSDLMRLVMLAKGVMVLTVAVFLFRQDGPLPVQVHSTQRHQGR